jgi:parvulin-like peptidyl-prolyl isomerase
MSSADRGPASGEFAKIGGEGVSRAEFVELVDRSSDGMMQMASYYGQPVTIDQRSMVAGTAYQQILRTHAEAAAAKAYGIQVSPGEAQREAEKRIDEQLNRVGEGLSPQERSDFRSRMLAAVDVESERRQLLGDRLRQRLTADAKPVEVKFAQVLVKTEKRTDDAALKVAQDVARQAKSGSDFAKLAEKYSEDPSSKKGGGVVGWASASPGQGVGEAAQQLDQEITAAALLLQKGAVSNPVRGAQGYHVLKALEVRDFQPKDETPKPEPGKKGAKPPKPVKEDPAKANEKRQQAIEQYRTSAGSAISEGLVAEQRRRLEATVQPSSSWLKAYLLEEKGGDAALPEVIAGYTEALRANEMPPAAAQGVAYHIVTLRQRVATDLEKKKQKDQAKVQRQEALKLLQTWARKDADMLFLRGEIQQQLGDKTKALESYKDALDRARRNAAVLAKLQPKLKELGRKDLADQAGKKQAELAAAEALERKKQQEAMEKQIADAAKKAKAEEAGKKGAVTPGGTKPITISPSGSSGPIKVEIGDDAKPAADAKKPTAKKPDTKKPEAKETPPAKP